MLSLQGSIKISLNSFNQRGLKLHTLCSHPLAFWLGLGAQDKQVESRLELINCFLEGSIELGDLDTIEGLCPKKLPAPVAKTGPLGPDLV